MKINIKNYRKHISTYHIAKFIFFWKDADCKYTNIVDNFAGWLSEDKNSNLTTLQRLLDKYNNRPRTIKIKIDPYDTYSMDHTLSCIILPMLKQLKDTRHASPCTDYEDAPEYYTPNIKDVQSDPLVHARWGWILNEMIFAFERINADDLFEDSQARIANGTRLFGKYYQALWD